MISEVTDGVILDYVPDALGSIHSVIDQDANVVKTMRYKPYGEVLSRSGTVADRHYQWVGSYGYRATFAPSSSHYVRARHYSATAGSWSTVDPLWPDESAYGYVNGRSVSIPDSSGEGPGLIGGLILPTPTPIPVVTPPPELWWPKNPPCRPPVAAGTSCAGAIIVVGVIATGDLIRYCCTGQPGPITGIGVAIGKNCYPMPVGQNAGERDPECTKDILAELERIVKATCRIRNQSYGCKEGMTQTELQKLLELNLACARARITREGRCWNGGDPIHKCEIKRAITHAKCCKYFASGGKKPCPYPFPDCSKVKP
jgi:RHS repeat-associated protein